MPVYNCESFVAEAVKSILTQTLTDFELIIIDDHSTDGTCGIIDGFQDPRIVFIKKQENSGLINSLNLGLSISKGQFIARMDGDDISHATRLEKQVDFLSEHPDIAICGTWYQLMDSNEIVKNPEVNESIKIAFLDYCALGHPTVMFRKDFITFHKLDYNPDFFAAEDYDLWIRISALGKLANLPEVLLSYRSHAEQVSIKQQAKQSANADRCRIRMMCAPLAQSTITDIETSTLLVRKTPIKSLEKLKEVLNWLDKLFDSNQNTTFYKADLFKSFIKKKKKELVRTFYLHTTSYSPKVLLEFSMVNEFRGYFTSLEYVKLAFKCAVYWRANSSVK